MEKEFIKSIPLVFLLNVALSSVGASDSYAGNLSDRLDRVEAKLDNMECMSGKLERIERNKANEAVLRGYFDKLANIDIEGAAQFFHEDMVLEMPTSPSAIAEHSPRRIVGRDAVVKYYQEGLAAEAASVSAIIHSIRHLDERDAMIFEYYEEGKFKDSDKTLELDVFSIIRFKDGKIIELIEYMDPLVMMELFSSEK